MENEYLASLFSLRDKTVVITGGTGGIGSAIVEAVLQAGVSSIASLELPGDSLSSALREKVSKLGGKIVSFECDMRDPKSLRSGFQAIEDAGLTPDILLNCAGVMRRNPCEAATDEELDLVRGAKRSRLYMLTECDSSLMSTSRHFTSLCKNLAVASYPKASKARLLILHLSHHIRQVSTQAYTRQPKVLFYK